VKNPGGDGEDYESTILRIGIMPTALAPHLYSWDALKTAL